MVYYKYWDNGQWNLGRMNILKAIICKLTLGDEFYFVPRKNIVYK